MAHEMPGAGHGFLWPLLTFDSDGEEIAVACRPSSPVSDEPFRYLAGFRDVIPALAFEKELDKFVSLVLARLVAVGVGRTDLHELWAEVQSERTDSRLAHRRRLEAQLGFEASEAPDGLLKHLDVLSHKVGTAAVEELAPACAGSEPERTLRQIEEFSLLHGREARISLPGGLASGASHFTVPWERGWSLTLAVRRSCGLETETVSDENLAGLIGIPAEALRQAGGAATRLPLGLAIRNGGRNRLKLLFRKRNRPALRFEAARFVAEQIMAPKDDRWLPATDTGTARQKVQRAFAAEFLCPIDALKDFLDGDFSSEAIEQASERFAVSELAVKSHLANHRQIPFDAVSG